MTLLICSSVVSNIDTYYHPANNVILGHTYCAACILSWLERLKTCPQCRINIGNRPVPAYAVQHQGK